MDHFEGVVLDYLRADRSLFLNSQCCIQLNPGHNPDITGPHWYCDAVGVSFKEKSIFLCEITYASPPASLMKRLTAWSKDWPLLCQALVRDSGVPSDWPVKPWLFVPEANIERITKFIDGLATSSMPRPEITKLEDVVPWRYRSWNRVAPPDPVGDA